MEANTSNGNTSSDVPAGSGLAASAAAVRGAIRTTEQVLAGPAGPQLSNALADALGNLRRSATALEKAAAMQASGGLAVAA